MKKNDNTIFRRSTEYKQKSVTIMISVDEKDTVFPVKFKSEGESFQ